MPNLRQLLEKHQSLLLLDASSSRIQVVHLNLGAEPLWAQSQEEAGRGLFTCLTSLKVDIANIPAFVFCEGPGSILGIRSTATVLRTWQVLKSRPIYSFGSLNLVAHALNRPNVGIIADARRETWHYQVLGQPMIRLPGIELTGELFMPEDFRCWSTIPKNVIRISYNLSELLKTAPEADIFRANEQPDAFVHTEPSYKTWTPQIHRAP
jgi:tRNA threonylcarbamoyladenosine biosynthesis protein TsaB|uniref:peptidase M22 n=1 Tax=Cephaloticoccus sp. TaxID=1985742 RepID=UPI00404A674D